VARISGKTILSQGVLPVRGLYDANIYFVTNPQSEPLAPLQDFNARLAREWAGRVENESVLESLDSRADELSSPLRQLLGSRTPAMPFSSSVLPDTGSHSVTSALLEAALKLVPMAEAEDVFGADMLSSWAQRSYESRAQRVPTEPVADASADVAVVPEVTASQTVRPVAAVALEPSAAAEPAEPAVPEASESAEKSIALASGEPAPAPQATVADSTDDAGSESAAAAQ
jgi:hypothetical protein